MKGTKYCWEWQLNSSPEKIWPLLSNIDLLATVTGIHGVSPFQPTRFLSSFIFLGVPEEDQEVPHNWIFEKSISSNIYYKRGMIKSLEHLITLEKNEAGTLLKHQMIIHPKNIIGSISIPWIVGKYGEKTLNELYTTADAILSSSSDLKVKDKVSFISQSKRKIVTEKAEVLEQEGFDSVWISHLVAKISFDPDSCISHMRPYHIAYLIGAPKRVILELFLAATKQQLLQGFWSINCPTCLSTKVEKESLKEVSKTFYCPKCEVEFGVNLCENVELLFRVHPSVRKTKTQKKNLIFPAFDSSLFMQWELKSDELFIKNISLPEGKYCIRPHNTPPSQWKVFSTTNKISGEIFFDVQDDGTKLIHLQEECDNVLKLANRKAINQKISIANISEKHHIISGTEANCNQYFKSHFSQEVPPWKDPFKVSNITILTTDLVASTKMYAEKGTFSSYQMIMELYEFQKEVVRSQEGAIVKVLGDGCIASFTDPKNAIKAALAIQEQFHTFNATLKEDEQLELKMGLHTGDAMAINLNNQLEFFGETINISAFLQRFGVGNSIVISDRLWQMRDIPSVILKSSVDIEKLPIQLPGFEEETQVYKLKEQEEV